MGINMDLFMSNKPKEFSLKLFPDQKQTLAKLKRSKDQGNKKIVVYSPTGSGKTAIAAFLCENLARQGKKVCFMSYQVILVYQTKYKFNEYGINNIGVIWAEADGNDVIPEAPIQISSIRTLKNRDLDEFDVFIWDECHNREQFLLDYMAENEESLFIGLSASPYSDFLGDNYDDLVLGPSIKDLIDLGRLSQYKLYAPEHPEEIKSQKGCDYSEKSASKAMDPIIRGDIVKHWFELGENNPTIAFCSSRGNSGDLVKSFRAAGVTAEHIDCFTPKIERDDIISRFERGLVKVICNVGVLTAGFDADVRTLINAAPTKNMKIWVQRFGRALRTAIGKEYAVILDFSGTYDYLGRPDDFVFTELNCGSTGDSRDYGENIDKPKSEKKDRTCSKCKIIYPKVLRACPQCNHKPLYSEEIEADYTANLVEVDSDGLRKKNKKAKRDKSDPNWQIELYSQLLCSFNEQNLTSKKKLKPSWPAVKFKEFIGVYPDKSVVNKAQPMDVTPEVAGLLKNSLIRYAKRIQKDLKGG